MSVFNAVGVVEKLSQSPELIFRPARRLPPRCEASRLCSARLCAGGFFGCMLLAAVCPWNAVAQGTLTNGWTHTGTIAPAGNSDVWTFPATMGDRIVVRVGEISQTNTFTPRLRLQNPSLVQIGIASGAVAAEISVSATNTDTFTVIVDDAAGTIATGTYRLTLAQVPATVFVSPGDEGGPLTNAVRHTGTIDVGDLDVWTFAANSGDGIQIRAGETTGGSSLTPAVWLYGPDGLLLDSLSGAIAAEVLVRATNSGTFTVVVGDFSSGYAGSGGYRLTLAKTGNPVVVSSGDEGGPATNGVMHTGALESGDLDVWTIAANSGDGIQVRAGETTGGSSLTPAVWLYGPDGALLSSAFGTVAAHVLLRTTNSGTFTVVVGDFSSGYAGSGGYRLTLAKTGDPVVISAGDEGGGATNGLMHTGIIDPGDLDVWTFSASADESIQIRSGEIALSALTPSLYLYGPNGALLDSYGGSAVAAEVSVRATNTGVFTIVAADNSAGYAGSGAYRLTLAKTGAPVSVSAGDEGGALVNGLTHTGIINAGDLDVWDFGANTGDNIVLRMGELTNNSPLTPALYLYGPGGALLGSYGSSAVAAEVTVRATNSGTFLVVAGDFTAGYAGAGPYRLTLVKTGTPLLLSAGDEGGALTGVTTYDAMIGSGDLDAFYFTACAGDPVSARVDELVVGSSLTPWLRLYGREGVLVRSLSGAATAQFSITATNTGTFILLVSDLSSGYAGSGTYRLTVNPLTAGLKLCMPQIAGATVNISGVGGTGGASFRLYTTTNVDTPFASWLAITTNQFDIYGVFLYPTQFNQGEPKRFYRLVEQ